MNRSAWVGFGFANGHVCWDKRAMQEYPGDFTKARIYHWLISGASATGILNSEKNPLESRVYYHYPDQTSGRGFVGSSGYRTAAARVLDDGSTQLFQFAPNDRGNSTNTIDPIGRTTKFTYATNNIDLLEVRQSVGVNHELLASFTYSTNHVPLTYVDAAGQTNWFAYNAFGQLTGLTNPLGQVTTLQYDTNGYLTNIVGAVTNATTTLSYDSYGRVRTVIDSEGYALTYDYDNLDRPSKVTYPDTTFDQTVYDRLDAVLSRDRSGRWSSSVYNALRQLVATEDALGRVTTFDWCSCGSLTSLTDALERTTTWVRDLQGRLTQKIYPDSTGVTYLYESNSSRLIRVTDARDQETHYEYFKDDNLKRVSYSNAVVSTPAVSLTYDTNYNRLLTMTDGLGTTAYTYYATTNGQAGAGSLQSVDGPWTNDVITYTYDELSRVQTRSIDGVGVKLSYDSLGRVDSVTNALGAFTNAYVNATPRLSSVSYPNGQTTTLSYYGNTNDQRLQTIWHKDGSAQTISKFDYGYNPVGQITNWTQQTSSGTPNVYALEYDPVDQLLAATVRSNSVAGTVLKQFFYSYDAAGNRTSERVDWGLTNASHNSLNQLTSLDGGGPVRFAGRLSELGTVRVAGLSAPLDTRSTNFAHYSQTSVGTNTVSITATDYSLNRRTNYYELVVTNGTAAQTLNYDLNGNLTTVLQGGVTNTYEWDAANRLIALNRGTNRSEFTYDGFGRRIVMSEKTNGVMQSEKWFLRCATELCEERASSGGTVSKRFFPEGEQIEGTNYFITRDHLGSVRELTDSSGTIQGRYEYDPYGRRTRVFGNLDADFAFTGHYYHSLSGLNLTLFRAYDPGTGKWVSRDPIEQGGVNLYAYCANNPLNYFDPLGLSRSACVADVVFNFVLGFIPGYNLVKVLLPFDIQPFQKAEGSDKMLDSDGWDYASAAASANDLWQKSKFKVGGGDDRLSRLKDLVSRQSFRDKSVTKQAALLGKLEALDKLRKVASVAGGVAQVFNAAAAAYDLYQCSKKDR